MRPKDDMLDKIAGQGVNIGQFVSFGPDGVQRFARIRGVDPSYQYGNFGEAARAIMHMGIPYVNIRSFLPDKPDGNPFIIGRNGFETPEKIAAKARELTSQGFYIIINEGIEINGGVISGVLLGDAAEFCTRDTPRCVEKPGCAALPRDIMFDFIETVHGHRVDIPYDPSYRVEFSAYAGRVGYRKKHELIWQVEHTESGRKMPRPTPHWPNRVSEDMGDKAYGLLIAHLYGFFVPRTHVIGRIMPPFEFGMRTKSPEPCWRRTCPKVQQPGRFTTTREPIDPFLLMQTEDPMGTDISALIFQDDVESRFAGAVITDAWDDVVIEGKAGYGDDFMVGAASSIELPAHVRDSVHGVWEKAHALFGPVRFEWCYDIAGTLWIVQFHVGRSDSAGNVVYPGEPERFEIFEVSRGLEALRACIEQAKRDHVGIILKGDVGITSHFGDVLRRNQIPSRLERG